MKIGVAVPFFNEEKCIEVTLEALWAQQDRDFCVVLCDNNSTDRSVEIVTDFIRSRQLPWKLVSESQKGTGAAADTAMRALVDMECVVLARTDADAIPDSNWIQQIRSDFTQAATAMVAGLSVPIRSEVSFAYFWMLRFASLLATIFGSIRASNYSNGMRSRYVMANGNNLAIRAEVYLKVGGFPRTRIEEVHEDRALVNSVRAAGLKVKRDRAMRVAVSARRVKRWGLVNSLRWYRSHYRPSVDVDIR